MSFLTTLNIKDEIEYVIDINPHRHGKFIPGTGKKIMPPEILKKLEPDVVLIMNPMYSGEICETLKDMNLQTQIFSI